LNSNRDHPSVMEMSVEEGDEARKLFALLVGMSRARICKDLAHEYDLTLDADEFARIHDEQAHRLRSGEDPNVVPTEPDLATQSTKKQSFGIDSELTHIGQPLEKLGDAAPKKIEHMKSWIKRFTNKVCCCG